MKRLMTLLSVIFLLFMLVACDEVDNSSEALEEAQTDTQTVESDEEENAETDEQEHEESNVETDEVEEEISNEIILGQPMEVGEYTITIQSYELSTDFEGNDALIVNYDWVNNSDDATMPALTYRLKGFQDGVETDDVFMVDGVDLGIGQKEVKSGGKIEGAQDAIGIGDMSKPLEIELDELFSFKDNPYVTVIDLSTFE